MVWQPGEFGRKVRFCRLFATIVAFFSRSGKNNALKPLFGVKYASGAGFFHNISR